MFHPYCGTEDFNFNKKKKSDRFKRRLISAQAGIWSGRRMEKWCLEEGTGGGDVEASTGKLVFYKKKILLKVSPFFECFATSVPPF